MSTESIQVLLEKLKHLSEKIDDLKTNQQEMAKDVKSLEQKIILVEQSQRERNETVREVKEEIDEINKFIANEKAKNNIYSRICSVLGGGKLYVFIIILLLLLIDGKAIFDAIPNLLQLFLG